MIVCLDTNIVIYMVEKKPVWTPKADAHVAALRAAGSGQCGRRETINL